jgi:ABC-type nitrate/sulfonate/bicarbonate transport system substrate-binding protein
MDVRRTLASFLLLSLAACGGAAPAASPPPAGAPPPPSAAAPASAAVKPSVAGSASAKPAAAASAAAKPSAAASTAAKPAASGLIPVKVAFTTISPTAAPLWVAKEKGIFAKNGLDASLSSTVANATIPAMMANELQIASSSPSEVASADVAGGSVVMIAEGTTLPIFSLFANKKYSSVESLDGQTIGVTAINAASDTAAHLFLKKYGMEGKVKTTAAGGSSGTVLAAMQNGGLAAGIVQPPVTIQATEAGFVELVNGVKLGVPASQGSMIVTRGYLKDHPDQIKAFLRSYLYGWRFAADPANKDQMIKYFEQYTKTEAKLSEGAYQYMVPIWNGAKVPDVSAEAISNALSFATDPKVKNADPKQFFDNSLLDEIAKEPV